MQPENPSKTAKNRRGRPSFSPSEEQRYSVEIMAAIGVPQDDIAAAIGIDPKTLRAHFRDELDLGATRANTKVAESLFRQALAGNVTAAIFWAKTRMGWKETERHEHTGKDGGAIQFEQVEADAATFRSRLLSGAIAGPATGGTGETQH